MKHFALNSQETYRTEISAEADERTMREIYLRGFERAIRIGHPTSIMCAYNKVQSIWCSETRWLLSEVLREDWGYDGMVVSDWGAVHHGAKAVKAGLDLRMPGNPDTICDVREALDRGELTMEEIDRCTERVLKFLLRPVPREESYDRQAQHEAARDVAREAICLLRNDSNLLPITPQKYRRICVTGEYAVRPYINGQGSAEVFTDPAYVDSPLDCLRRLLPDVQIDYFDYLPRKKPDTMLWNTFTQQMPGIRDYDLVLVFTGAEPSDDSEEFDRGSNQLAGFIEDVMRNVTSHNPNCVLVLEYSEKWRVGYRYYDLHPEEIWFPFGHGLHYTTFKYDHVSIEPNVRGWVLSFDLSNIGSMDDAEVVQIYIGDPVSTASKPVKELRQFDKVFLKAGESRRVSFLLTEEDLCSGRWKTVCTMCTSAPPRGTYG